MAHYVLYIPGVGDHRAKAQRLAVGLWRLYGVRGEFFPVRWNDQEAFNVKLPRLLGRVDDLLAGGHKVSLVAASAGASMALAAYEQRKRQIESVVCVCGKINHIETVNPSYYRANPAFRESLASMAAALPRLASADRRHIVSARPLYDEVVPVADAILEGTQTWRLPVIGHAIGIGYVLTIGASKLMRLLKKS